MNNNTTSQFMDKQIMDLSNSQSSTNNEFIDFMNRQPEKKDDVVASYDFMPIRPAVVSPSPPPPASNFNSDDDDAPIRTRNSFNQNDFSTRNYPSLDAADEPGKLILEKNHKPVNASTDVSLVSEIDSTMKKFADNLMYAMDGVTARLSQLETRTQGLESSMDDLKVSLGNNHGSTDGKMRQLENILREVQTGVQVIRDKQVLVIEAQLNTSKLQVQKVEQEVESRNTPHNNSTHQHFSTGALTQPPPPTLTPPNAFHPPPPSHPNLQPQLQLPPNQFPQKNPVPSLPQQEPYYPPPAQTPQNPNLQYQINPPQQQHPAPSPPPSQHQYQPLPPPLQPLGHHPEGTLYPPPQTYPPAIRPPSSQNFYGPNQNTYEPPSSRPGPTQGSGYPQLPTARILPQGMPNAFSVAGGGSGPPGSSGSGPNRVAIDDVVDKVTNMGFSREQVRATVRRLTENGQAVDLNIVLDKLMNDGEAPGWLAR